MNKRNYEDEAFVHVVNIVSKWPLAIRETLRRNRTVSLSGRKGHDLADDEFVEERLIRRTKNVRKETGHSERIGEDKYYPRLFCRSRICLYERL